MEWLMWAQTDVVSGLPGWVVAITTVGLLGPVLYWLCYVHLPAKDTQMEKLIKAKDDLAKELADRNEKNVAKIVEAYEKESQGARNEFKTAISTILTHCERETQKLTEACGAEVGRAIEAFRVEIARVIESFRVEIARVIERERR